MLDAAGSWLSSFPRVAHVWEKLPKSRSHSFEKPHVQYVIVMWVLRPGPLTLFRKTLKGHPSFIILRRIRWDHFCIYISVYYSFHTDLTLHLWQMYYLDYAPKLPPSHTNTRVWVCSLRNQIHDSWYPKWSWEVWDQIISWLIGNEDVISGMSWSTNCP